MRSYYLIVVPALAGALMSVAGCESKPATTQAEPAARPPVVVAPQSKRPPKGGMREMVVRKGVLDELHQLGLFYQQFRDTYQRSPNDFAEFRGYIEREASKLVDAITDEYYTVVWKLEKLNTSVVVAYETEADNEGKRYVVLGDASVQKMTEDQFRNALQGR